MAPTAWSAVNFDDTSDELIPHAPESEDFPKILGRCRIHHYTVGNDGTIESTPAGPLLARPTTTQTRTLGETATLRTTALGLAPISYRWSKDGGFLPGETNATLELTSLTRAASGEYRVEIQNSAGTLLRTFPLTVRVPFKWSVPGNPSLGGIEFTATFIDRVAVTSSNSSNVEVEVSADLADWEVLPDPPRIENGALILREATGNNQERRYYRIRQR